MKTNLPILNRAIFCSVLLTGCVLAAHWPVRVSPAQELATANVVAPAGDLQEGDNLMQQAVQAMERHESVSAKSRQQVSLFGQVCLGSGEYFQQGLAENRRVRLALRMQLGKKASSLLQVCDGSYLWISTETEKQPQLKRVDLTRVRSAQNESGGPSVPSFSMQGWTAGGLPFLVSSLAANFTFTSVERDELQKMPVYVIRGGWRPKQLAALFPAGKHDDGSSKPANLRKLPSHVPQTVIVLLGTQDLFPYVVQFHRSGSNSKKTESGNVEPSKPIVTLEWFEVRLNGPINPQEFVYQAGSRRFSDATDEYLKSVGLTAK